MQTDFTNLQPEKYFEPIIPEEDNPITIDEESSKMYQRLESIFNSFYPNNSTQLAKEKSKEERDNKRINDTSFAYGEITFRSLAYIYQYIINEFGSTIRDGNFYDLGSGIGKGVLGFSLLRPFKSCIGIEYLENLTQISQNIKKDYESKIDSIIKENQDLFADLQEPNLVEFINGDFLKQKWTDTSIMLIASTCFSNEIMDKIGKKANKECQSGTIIISFTKRVGNLNKDWELKDGFRRVMSWGIASIYIHRRK